jgi:cytochrome c-type biogenesis protein
MIGLDVSFGGAFVAGLLSFLSPCILPLVPPYLCFLGGVSLQQLEEGQDVDRGAMRRVVLASIVFVLGFATVFIAFGATASYFGQLLAENFKILSWIAGGLIILLGLHFLGVFRIALLYREARFHIEKKPAGLIGAYVIGLMIAGAEDSAAQGAGLLAAYAGGIGVPFIAAAFFAPLFMRFMARFRHYQGWIERILGALLVLTGILFITGGINDIGNWLLMTFPDLFGTIG